MINGSEIILLDEESFSKYQLGHNLVVDLDEWNYPLLKKIDSKGNFEALPQIMIEIIEKHGDSSIVDIDDVLEVEIFYNGKVKKELIYLSCLPIDSFIKTIPLNTAFGLNAYRKLVGSKFSYLIGDREVIVKIIRKINSKRRTLQK